VRRKIVFSLAAFFLVFGLIVLGYQQLNASGHAGYVIIGIGDLVLETSLYFIIFLTVFVFVAVYLGIQFTTGAAKLPEAIKRRHHQERHKRAMEALLEGFVETIEGKWDKAERNLIRHASDSTLPLLNYLVAARAAHLRGADEQREDYLKLALKVAPDAPLAVALTRTSLMIGTQQFDRALEHLAEINRTFPNHPLVLRMMADAYIRTKDWDALHYLIPALREAKLFAESELRKLELDAYQSLLRKRALTKDPGLIREIWRMVPPHLKSEAVLVEPYSRGMMDAGVGKEVEEDLRLALGRDWNTPLLDVYAQIEDDDPIRQLAHCKDWLGPHRDDPALLALLAKLSFRAGQGEAALDYAKASLSLDPTPQALKVLADLMFARKEDVAASRLYRQGLRLALGEPMEADMIATALAILAPSQVVLEAPAEDRLERPDIAR
jgi:HemY protein